MLNESPENSEMDVSLKTPRAEVKTAIHQSVSFMCFISTIEFNWRFVYLDK